MLSIDGSSGEGGGQILRTSLALSCLTGTAIEIHKIRAGRARPGLMRQHLTAVEAAAQISAAKVRGGEIGSKELVFEPGPVRPGRYHFAVGTAGSATLVLQTVLPALLRAGGRSELELEGGTHNPSAPPFDFLARSFLPLLERMGPRVRAVLERYGFYPAGGGRMRVEVEPVEHLARLDLLERGEIRRKTVRALVSDLPDSIAKRETGEVLSVLGWDRSSARTERIDDARGPGNVVLIEIESENVTEVITGFGEKGVRAEIVAQRAAREAKKYLESGVPVGEHLADQLLLPMVLAGGGSFRTGPLSQHAHTQIETIARFIEDVAIQSEDEGGSALVTVG